MSQTIPENRKISPFFVFFIVHGAQTGIGILGFQRTIAKSAGYDAWMSIILTGTVISILVWMIYKMLSIVDGDIVSIHCYLLGNKAGKWISSVFILYFYMLMVAVVRGYIEIIQVWMFPDLETFWFSLVFLLVVLYIVHGGFRTVTGIAFYSVVLPAYIFLIFLLTLPYADFNNLLPIFDHSMKDILKASRDMTFSFLGFEVLLFYYPFIKNPQKSRKFAQLGNMFSTFVYIYLAVLTFSYFSEEQLQKNIWATLTMWKIIQLPFVERFEYIGIANWFFITLPNVSLSLWCASRLAKQIFSIRQKTTLPVLVLLVLVGTSLLTTREQVTLFGDLTGKLGLYFSLVYIPMLFTATLIAQKVKNRGNHS
ncbi:GerAB/ArcD/ProY family transporter [Neobacillus sp. LXY-4]|uniref:GerAB/ArcD/ProY family transporter n=1 Tax=Neobacillus sp. LXY-4 TaxID=3379826 RepID=UPI003EDFCBD1